MHNILQRLHVQSTPGSGGSDGKSPIRVLTSHTENSSVNKDAPSFCMYYSMVLTGNVSGTYYMLKKLIQKKEA